MKTLFIFFCVISLSVNAAPSFDCNKARSNTEILICSDSDLGDADIKLSSAYRKALQDSTNPDELKAKQIDWLRNQRNRCEDKVCLLDSIEKRISELEFSAVKPRMDSVNESQPPASLSRETGEKFVQQVETSTVTEERVAPVLVESKITEANQISDINKHNPPNSTESMGIGTTEGLFYFLCAMFGLSTLCALIFGGKVICFANQGDYFASTGIALVSLLFGASYEKYAIPTTIAYLVIMYIFAFVANERSPLFGAIGALSRSFFGVTCGLLVFMNWQSESDKASADAHSTNMAKKMGRSVLAERQRLNARRRDQKKSSEFFGKYVIDLFVVNKNRVNANSMQTSN